jgi:acetyl esterase/lipase
MVSAACIAEPIERSPLNTYPPINTSAGPVVTSTKSSSLPPERVEVITLAKDQPLAGSIRYDIYGPDRGAELPVVVIVHDLDGADQATDLGLALATENLVIIPHYDSPVRGGRFPDPLSAASCALALASDASVFGGDPDQVTVIGAGFGALAAFIVLTTDDLYLPTSCQYAGAVRPTGLIALGGTWSPSQLAADAFDTMNAFMGGTPEQAPSTWELLNPDQYVDRPPFQVTLLRADNDPNPEVTDLFAAQLLEAEWSLVVGIIRENTSRSALTNAAGEIAEYLDRR